MPLGWIDFSKSDRNKVLSVLDRLSEDGTLDELGIAPIRDGYANIFFPGTSTLQSRAKYFLIVPYALKELECSNETDPEKVMRILDELERDCGKQLLAYRKDTDGIIGKQSIRHDSWVKSTPSDLYWAGLRYYGIFTGGTLSLSEYVRTMCELKKRKTTLSGLGKLGNKNDKDEDDCDDKDAGDLFRMQFWNIPTYNKEWKKNLKIKLTKDEGAFLKRQIIQSYPDSMMAYILKNNLAKVIEADTFVDLFSLRRLFPKEMQEDFITARDFSWFLYIIRIIYNMIISDGENEKANDEWKRMKSELRDCADVDLDMIFRRLQISDKGLCVFLRREQRLMLAGDLEGMKKEIIKREECVKPGRAKTKHPGEFDVKSWYGGDWLDYRFGTAKVIIKDIFESEGSHA